MREKNKLTETARTVTAHTPTPWLLTHDNDTGPNDESFVEWIEVGPATIRLPPFSSAARQSAEKDAAFILEAVNAHDSLKAQRDELLAALEDVISQIYAEGPIDLLKAETAIENAKSEEQHAKST